MKYMKLGTKPDTFFTEAAVRSVLSEIPADLTIEVDSTKYQLHKFPLILKSGLIQHFCSNSNDDSSIPVTVTLHDILGGEEAFELCAKFCYGIAINISAHNFASAVSGARFLRMTESVAKGNFITKLELFFNSSILQGWKDSITTLQSMWRLTGWSDDHRIVQPCMDSIIEKILVHPSEVTWSYTYTRPGYKKQHNSVPKDWWTEDVSDLDLDIFRSIISTVRSTRKLLPALIGEALHVYACKHLPDPEDLKYTIESSSTQTDEALGKQRRILESIVSMIPSQRGSVSGKFILRLLKLAIHVRASSSTRAELLKRGGCQLDEVSATDLLITLISNPQSYDIGAVETLVENFLAQFRQPVSQEIAESMISSMKRVGKTFDSYLQIIARDGDIPVLKFIELAESLPDMAREEHNGLYEAINTYLKEHAELSKENKKRLCQVIDCQKLSAETRASAIANEKLPLRTVVQLLFVEQEKAGGARGSQDKPHQCPSVEISEVRETCKKGQIAEGLQVGKPSRVHQEKKTGTARVTTTPFESNERKEVRTEKDNKVGSKKSHSKQMKPTKRETSMQ